jgi:hypothetical protein
MNNEQITTVPKQIRCMVYIGEDLFTAFRKYIEKNYPGSKYMTSTLIRKLLADFLRSEGYYDQKEVNEW